MKIAAICSGEYDEFRVWLLFGDVDEARSFLRSQGREPATPDPYSDDEPWSTEAGERGYDVLYGWQPFIRLYDFVPAGSPTPAIPCPCRRSNEPRNDEELACPWHGTPEDLL